MRHAIALKINDDTTEDELISSVGKKTKVCSGCDPDMPGHVPQKSCRKCRGTGQEPYLFLSVLKETREREKPKKQQMDDDLYVEP